MNGGAVNQDNVLGNTGGYGDVISDFNSSYNKEIKFKGDRIL